MYPKRQLKVHGLLDVMCEHAAVAAVACWGAATIATALHRLHTVHCHPSQLPLRCRRHHPPLPAFADPFIGWLLC